MSKQTSKEVISEEVALNELKSFIHKWVKRPCKDDQLADEYSDILEAIKSGNLVIDSVTKVPVYTLLDPIKNEDGNISKTTVEFKTRIKPTTKASLAEGLDLKKQVAKYSLIIISHVIGCTVNELDRFEKEDYDVISQIATLFM